MARILDVAKYILSKQGCMSTMKLQKLCYYSQAWSLVWDDAPLFDEDFQAWANGPVSPELFECHRGLYSISADSPCMAEGNIENVNEIQRKTIDQVLDYYGDKNAQWLSALTHMESPWRDARGGTPDGCACTKVISKESMAMYYAAL